jgi:hypothetical protein
LHDLLRWIATWPPAVDRLLLILSTTFVILSVVAYWIREFAGPVWRRRRLTSPVKARFLITSRDRYDLRYAMQDDREHETELLVLPSHTHAVLMHVVWKVKLDFTQHELEFSFEGNETEKPLFDCWFHPFIRSGDRRRVPGVHPGHYLDYHGNYHIERVRQSAKGQTVTAAFLIHTRGPGIYYLKIGIVADGVDGVADGTAGATGLRIIVQDHATRNMRCKTHPRCRIGPR